MSDFRPLSVSSPVLHQPIFTVSPPEARQPAQFHGKDVDEPDADEESGQRHANQADRHDGVREKSRAVDRDINPEEHAEEGRDQRRKHGQLHRCRQSLLDEIRHFPRLPVRDAELAGCRIAHESGELHGPGVVEPKAFRKLLPVLQGGFLPKHVCDRIAHEAKHRKRDEGHRDEDQQALGDGADGIGEHGDALRVESGKAGARWRPGPASARHEPLKTTDLIFGVLATSTGMSRLLFIA